MERLSQYLMQNFHSIDVGCQEIRRVLGNGLDATSYGLGNLVVHIVVHETRITEGFDDGIEDTTAIFEFLTQT